jgi:hypothetical protein
MQAHQDETSHVYTYQGSQGVVFAGVVFVVFLSQPLLRQSLVKWFLSSKVELAIHLRPRTFFEPLLRAELSRVSNLLLAHLSHTLTQKQATYNSQSTNLWLQHSSSQDDREVGMMICNCTSK